MITDQYGYPHTYAGALGPNHLRINGDTLWSQNNSSLHTYAGDLTYKNPGAPNEMVDLHYFIGRHVVPTDAAIDIAGGTEGRALQDLIHAGMISRGLVTNFEDLRSDAAKAEERLDHIEGSILLPKAWFRIKRWQHEHAPDGVGLIMYRPVHGLQGLPNEYYETATDMLIRLVRPGGMLFAQVPDCLTLWPEILEAQTKSIEDNPLVGASNIHFAETGYHQRKYVILIKKSPPAKVL